MESREVVIEGGADSPPTPAYAALPDAPATYGVVVIHELFGRQPDIDRACDRIARQGAAAVAPDLSARGRIPCLVDMFRAVRTGRGVGVAQAHAARDWLAREASLAPDRIALLGFCAGGGFALAAGRGFAAVSTNYGEVPDIEILRGIGPVIGCYGGRDRVFGANQAERLRDRLVTLGVKHEVNVFPEAGHSFLTDTKHEIGRILMPAMGFTDAPEAREAGWTKIFAFFDQCFG
ncbi:MAG: dienelactone hydrolase family protein [Polyangiaceae bacterium]